MHRMLRYIAIPPSYRHITNIKRRFITTNPLTHWMDDTLPIMATTSPLKHDTESSHPQQTSTSGMLSQFYRGLATHNIDQLWPLYSTMYHHHLHTRLTRNNYRQLVQVAARSPKTQRNLHRLLAVMEDMQHLSIPLRLSDYNIIMRWIGGATVPQRRPRHVTDALGWLATMEKQQLPTIEPSVVTYNTLIHVASQANDILTAQRLYHAMLAKGMDADAYTYTTLLHSMATMGDVQGVQDMVTRLERKGLGELLHSTVTWNILLDCYYTSSTQDDDGICYRSKADDMFQSMVDGNNAPMADHITYQIHMDHLLRHHQRDEAIHLLNTKLSHDDDDEIKPTLTMYNKLFASFMKPTTSSGLPQLRQLYTSFLQQQQLQPTSETLYTLINALLDHHDTTFALEAFVHLCQERNIAPCQELLDRLASVLQDNDPSTID